MEERQIGNYRILKQIGAGGMAKVYLAVHKDVPNLKVVLKILSSPQHAARFMQEADKLALLERNPNICHIRHFFNHEDDLVIAMEYIDGKSLEEMIAEKGKFPVEETIRIVADLLTALAFAHEKEIYHRDIKPGNIMFDRDGQLKIIDFGIAKGKTDPQMTIVGTATGTPEYMAPEQFAGGEHLDYAKCDIYAVGTMMYAMLAGQPPFKGENEFVLRDAKLLENPAPPSRLNKEISGELDRIILKAMDKDPAKRFASVAEMKSDLLKLSRKPGRPGKGPAAEKVPEFNAGSAAEGVSAPARGSASAGSSRRMLPRGRGKSGTIIGAVVGVIIIAVAAIFGIRMMSGGNGGERGRGARVTMLAKDSVATLLPTQEETQKAAESAAQSSGGTGEPAIAGTGAGITADKGKDEEEHAGSSGKMKPPPTPVASGFLRVGSEPKQASIYIDGKLQINKPTPMEFTLPPGQYAIRIVKMINGKMAQHDSTVTIESGRTTIVFKKFKD